MKSLTTFGIALGSNLGDRRSQLECGVEHLLARISGVRLLAAASLYETDPVDCPPDALPFLNTVIELETALSPPEMHTHLLAVEALMGRPGQRAHHAPRTLDLDLLYADSYVSDDPILTVPHPRLHLRRFVLQPLAEIRPHLRLPGLPGDMATLLAGLEDDPATVRVAGSWSYQPLSQD